MAGKEAGEEAEVEWYCKELRGWLAAQETMHLENRLVLEAAGNTGVSAMRQHRAMPDTDANFSFSLQWLYLSLHLHRAFSFSFNKEKRYSAELWFMAEAEAITLLSCDIQ